MRNVNALDALFPKTRQGILAATLVQPEKVWYVSELARRMGVPSSSLQRELQELTRLDKRGFGSTPECYSPQGARDRIGDVAADERFAEHVDDTCALRAFGQLRTTVAAHEYD